MARSLSFASSALFVLVAAPAFAGSLATSFVFVNAGDTPHCIITNVDSKDIEVTASATSLAGTVRTPESNICPTPPSTLNAGASCYTSYIDGADLACRFTAKGKVRASVQILDGSNNVRVAIPATAK
jgi:hypothetical protein